MSIAQDNGATDAHESFLRTKNFSALNGVRCLCCLAVIKEHVGWVVPGPRLFSHGSFGVDLFFGISGFLIVTLLIRERERLGAISLKKFYARRTLRIFPIYYLLIISVFVFFLAISPWSPGSLNYYLMTFPVLLTYTQDVIRVPLGGFFHCWSLAMEEQFYLFWPAVERYAIRPFRWVILGGLLALNQGINLGAFDDLIASIYGDTAARRLPIFLITFTPILLGVLLAYLLHERASFKVLYRLVGARVSPFLFLGLVFAICEWSPEVSRGPARLGIHIALMLLLGSLVAREDHYARPLLTFAPIARIGVISYGVYLYHVWIIQGVLAAQNRLHFNQMGTIQSFIFVTIVTVIVAEASYRLIEKPLLNYKQRFHS